MRAEGLAGLGRARGAAAPRRRRRCARRRGTSTTRSYIWRRSARHGTSATIAASTSSARGEPVALHVEPRAAGEDPALGGERARRPAPRPCRRASTGSPRHDDTPPIEHAFGRRRAVAGRVGGGSGAIPGGGDLERCGIVSTMTTTGDRPVAARVRNLTKTYGTGDAMVRALDDVSLDLVEGEFTAIMGPSGSGKSTLMHCCAALDTATSGEVWIGDRELGGLKDKELTRLRRDEVGFVFQSFNLVPTLTARGEHPAAAVHRPAQARPRVVRLGHRHRRHPRPPRPPAQPALRRPAAARRRGPRPRRPARASSSPTSPPATSTRSRAPRCSTCSGAAPATTARRS